MLPILSQEEVRKFLNKNQITSYSINKVAGDASFRSYYRITHNQDTFILMFAPPPYENIEPFIIVDRTLKNHNFLAPEIFNFDRENGFILLEDFGDITYSKAISGLMDLEKKAYELKIYKKACDILSDLKTLELTSIDYLSPYNNAVLLREVLLFIDWYLPFVKKKHLTLKERFRFKKLFFDLFDLLDTKNQVLVLRDYHADNLMVVKEGVGLLDFQDALIGSAAYDLVSLLEDARRDINDENREELLSYYLAKQDSNFDQNSFLTDYKILSLQRNIKIIGIFARLANRDSKPHYLDHLPRILNYVETRLNGNDFCQKMLGNNDKTTQAFFELNKFLIKYLS